MEKIQSADNTLTFSADKKRSTASPAIKRQIERLTSTSYFEKIKLQLKALKTELVTFSQHANPGNREMSIKVREQKIHASKSVEYWDMSCQTQIKATLRNMATFIRNLHQIRNNFPSTTRLLLFKTLVINQLEHPIFMFTDLSKTQINYMDKLNNWGNKTVFFCKKWEMSSDLKTKRQILPFEAFQKYSSSIYFILLLKNQIISVKKCFMFPNCN